MPVVDVEVVLTGVGVVISNGIFFKISAFFVKRWMDQKDASEARAKLDLEKSAQRVAAELERTAGKLAVDLKDSVAEHRQEIKDMTKKLDGSVAPGSGTRGARGSLERFVRPAGSPPRQGIEKIEA